MQGKSFFGVAAGILMVWAHGALAAESAETVDPALAARLVEEATACQEWPAEEQLPLPPSGWYTLELAGETIDVFRDEYGVPHVFAPSIPGAFRAQGYVTAEDRCLQLLKRREAVLGRMAALNGESGLGHDQSIRTRGFTRDEMRAMMAALPSQQREYLEAYTEGINAYLARVAPTIPPVETYEFVAGAVYFITRIGDMLDQDYDLFRLLGVVRMFKGDEFARNMLEDCMPLDVPTAPTTDHSLPEPEPEPAPRERPASRQPIVDPEPLAALLREELELRAYARAEGVTAELGSQAWAVSSRRSTTGHAMLFASPQLQYDAPANGILTHLVAPGLNISGVSHVGIPGIIVGHNERIAWGVTSGLLDQYDVFIEQLNPENPHQYRHNGQWKDMERIEAPIVLRNEDGDYEVIPYTVYRTLHGPVLIWDEENHRAYAKAHSLWGLQLQAFASYIELAFARDFTQFEEVLRKITGAHHFIAGDTDGNIGYWLTGRMPIRREGHDPRLPVFGTGEFDWQGIAVATDFAHSINPKEGWFGNYNDKPGVRVPGFWPEYALGHRIRQTLLETNPIDWETFVGINRANAEQHMVAAYLKPYLLGLLEQHAVDNPDVSAARDFIAAWPETDAEGSSAALLFNEWLMDTMVELLAPEFGILVERNMDLTNLQIFGILAFRILEPERSGIVLKGDYLDGRDKDAIAFKCFLGALKRLTERHGPNMEEWPYEPPMQDFPHIGRYPWRQSGTYWMAVELSDPMRVRDMLVPGQCGLQRSPHFNDQVDLFHYWQLKPSRYLPEDFGYRGYGEQQPPENGHGR